MHSFVLASLLLCSFCGQPSHAVQNQAEPEAAASSIPGAFIIPPKFERAGQFSEGLAAVQVSEAEGWKWGYIDKSGNFVIKPQFDQAEDFSEGLAAVRIGDEATGEWGFIDRSGNIVISPNLGPCDTVFKRSRHCSNGQCDDGERARH